MSSRKRTISPMYMVAAASAGGIAIVIGSLMLTQTLLAKRSVAKAEDFLKKGLPLLAVEAVDGHRERLVRMEKGCETLISAYFRARQVDRLEWASERCVESGRDIPEAYLGMAANREFTGRDMEALQILGNAAQKFDKIPDAYYQMAQIFRRLKNDEAATGTFMRAAERAGDNQQVVLDALEYFGQQNRWNLAKMMADKLKDAKTDNPEVKLVIARAFTKGGDAASAQKAVVEARDLMEKKPEIKQALMQAYADVLTPGSASNGSGTAPASVRR